MELIEHKDEAVREVARAYFAALLHILITRSLFVKLSVYVTKSGIVTFSVLRQWLSLVFRTESEAYSQHKTLQALSSA